MVGIAPCRTAAAAGFRSRAWSGDLYRPRGQPENVSVIDIEAIASFVTPAAVAAAFPIPAIVPCNWSRIWLSGSRTPWASVNLRFAFARASAIAAVGAVRLRNIIVSA